MHTHTHTCRCGPHKAETMGPGWGQTCRRVRSVRDGRGRGPECPEKPRELLGGQAGLSPAEREVLSDAETPDEGDAGCPELGCPRELEEPDWGKASWAAYGVRTYVLRRDKTYREGRGHCVSHGAEFRFFKTCASAGGARMAGAKLPPRLTRVASAVQRERVPPPPSRPHAAPPP